MAQQVGIGLGRSGAFVVSVTKNKAETTSIASDIDQTRRPLRGTEGHCTIIPEHRLRRRRDEFLKRFYRSIVHSVRDAGMIFVFGPGAAKQELIREMARVKGLTSRVVGVETTDRMTPRQVELRVQEFFAMYAAASNP